MPRSRACRPAGWSGSPDGHEPEARRLHLDLRAAADRGDRDPGHGAWLRRGRAARRSPGVPAEGGRVADARPRPRGLLADAGQRRSRDPDAAARAAALDYYRRLVDFAAEIGGAIVSFHGLVGRIAPLASMAEEEELLARSLRSVCEHARPAGVRIVYEVLNRYESHLVNTGQAALALIERVGADNLCRPARRLSHEHRGGGTAAEAIRAVGRRLGLFHVADSNREGIGRGHTDFAGIARALDAIGYQGPVIVECTGGRCQPVHAGQARRLSRRVRGLPRDQPRLAARRMRLGRERCPNCS